jgi:hypothetical protein
MHSSEEASVYHQDSKTWMLIKSLFLFSKMQSILLQF